MDSLRECKRVPFVHVPDSGLSMSMPKQTNQEIAVRGSTTPNSPTTSSSGPATPTVASRGKILMMAIIAGAVITNVYCTQPILPLIAAGLHVDLTTVDLVAAAALLGFSG